MTHPGGALNRAQLRQIEELRRTVVETLAHNPSWRELAKNVEHLTRDAAPAARLGEWAALMSAAVEPLPQNVGMAVGMTASMDRALRVVSMATSRAIEPSQIETVRALLNSFSEKLSTRSPSSSLFSAAIQLDEDETLEIEVPVPAADDNEAEPLTKAFLEVVAQEAPDVAEAIDAAAAAAPPSLGLDRARFILGWAVVSIVLSAHIAGAILPFPWNAIIAMLLGTPQALAAGDSIDPE